MKHTFSLAIALLLMPLAAVAQDAPDDRYIAIYDLIQQADGLTDNNSIKEAQAKYSEAYSALVKFQKDYPKWNTKIVNFRLNYLAGKTGSVQPKPAGEPATTPPPAPPAPETATDGQIKALQDALRSAQADKAALEDKLKAAVAAPAPVANAVPAQAEMQSQIDSLLAENKILKASLKAQPTNAAPTIDAATLERLSKDLAENQRKLEEKSSALTALAQDKAALQQQLETVKAENQSAANASLVATLQNQLKQVEADKADLQARLQAAATVQTDMVDAKQLVQAEEKLKQLQKENSLLRAGLEQRHLDTIQLTNTVAVEQTKQALADTQRKLQEQTELVASLMREKEAVQKQLASMADAAATARELAQTKQSLAALKRKHALQADAAILLIAEANLKLERQIKINAELTKENQLLQKKLSDLASNTKFVVEGLRSENAALSKQLAERKNSAKEPELSTEGLQALEQLQAQLAKLRAKVNVLEATAVPFTPEELALFRQPESATLASPAADTKTRKLPNGAADLVAEAQRLFAQHNFTQAHEKYLEVLKLDGQNVYTLGNLATIELELNQMPEAEKHLQTALSVKPNDAFCLGVLGNLRFREGKYDLALDALSRAATLNPKDPEVQNFLGVTLSQKGQRTAAEAALRKAIQLDPEYGSAHNNLAVIYLTQTPPQIELARWHYQKARAAGQGRNQQLETLLEQSAAPAPAPAPAEAKP